MNAYNRVAAAAVALPGPSSLVALGIEAYQRFLSPYKGFRCAHRALHGRESCSQFAKRVVMKWGAAAMMPLLRKRFAECAAAKEVLVYESGAAASVSRRRDADLDEERRKKRESTMDACDCGSPGDCSGPIPDFSGCDGIGVPDAADCGSCADIGDCAGGIGDCGI